MSKTRSVLHTRPARNRRSIPGSRSRLPLIVASSISALVTVLASSHDANAANTFTGSGTSWDLPADWSTNLIPSLTDDLLFNSGAATTLDGSFAVRSLSFNVGTGTLSIDANAAGTTTPRTLTLNGDGAGTDALGNSGTLIDVAGATSGSVGVNVGTATGVGTTTVALSASGAFNIGNSATLNFGANSVISGAFNLSQTGTGTLILAGTNTFGGASNNFTLNSGTLDINSSAALGNASNTFVINGGTIDNTSGASITTSNYAQTWAGDFTFAGSNALNLGAGAVTLSGNRTVTVNGSGPLTIGGVVSGSGTSFTKAGNGTLILTGASTYAGTVTIGGGTLQVGNGGSTGSLNSATIVNNGNLVYNLNSSGGVVQNGVTGTGSINATLGGIDFLADAKVSGSQSYNQVGGGTLYAGLQVGASTPSVTLSGSSVTLSGDLGHYAANGSTMTVDTSAVNGPINLNISLGRSGVWYNLNGFTANAGTGSITISGTYSGAGWNGTPVVLSGGVNVAANVSSSALVTINANAPSIVSGVLSGSMPLTVGGTSLLALNSASTYTGATTVNSGTLEFARGTAPSTAITVNAGTLQIDSTGKTLSALTMNNAAAVLALAAVPGATTTVTGAFNQAANYSVIPVFASLPAVTGATPINLLTAGSIGAGAGTGSLNLSAYGASRVTGSLALVGTHLQLSITNGGANLVWDNGSSTGNWIVNSSTDKNFNNGGTNDVFMSYDAVTFDSTATPGPVNLVGTLAPSAVSVANTSGTYVFSGTGSIVGGGSLSKSGAGTLTISTANSYSGGTTLSAGQMNINNASAIGTGPLTIAGGTIDNTSGADITLATNNPQTWNGNFTYVGSNSLNTGVGAVTLSASSAVTVGANTLTVGGPITGAFGLTKAGNGTLTLTGANTYSGATTVSAGTLLTVNPSSADANGNGGWRTSAISIAPGATLQFALNTGGWEAPNNSLTISGGGTLKITGTNTLRLGGQTTGYATTISMSQGGLIDVEGGTLELDYATSYGAWANNKASMTIAAGAIFDVWDYANGLLPIDALNGGGTIQRHYAGSGINIGVADGSGNFSGVIQNGSYTMNVTKSGAGTQIFSGANTYTGTTTVSAGTLTLANALAVQNSTVTPAGGSIVFDKSVTGNAFTFGGLAGSGNLTLANNAASPAPIALTVGGNNTANTYSGILSGAGSLTKAGTAVITLTGSNTYTGQTNLNGGSLNLGAAGAIPSSSQITFGGGALQYSAANTTDYSPQFATTANQAYSVDTNGQNVTWAANLVSTGGSLTKAGTGTLTLTGTNNTYTGGTTVTAGTLQIAAGSTFGAATGSLTANGGILDLGGTSQTVGAVNIGGGTIQNGGLTATSYTATSGVVSANLGGTVGLTENGAGGTLTLSGTNTYSGPTTINAGTVDFATRTAFYNNVPSNWTATNLVVSSGGTAAFYVGAAQFTSTDFANFLALSTATGGFKSGSAIGFDTTPGNFTYSAVLANTNGGANVLGLAKLGTNTLTLTAANTFTGPATVSGGTLNLSNALALLNNTLTLAGGSVAFDSSVSPNAFTIGGLAGTSNLALQNNAASPAAVALTVGGNNANTTYSGVLTGSGSLTKVGNGTLTLSGNNSYSGLTTITAGTVTISDTANNMTLGNTATVINAGATLVINENNSGSVASGSNTNHHGSLGGYTGQGTYQKTGAGAWSMYWLGSGAIAFGSGALIDIEQGTLFLGYGGAATWTNNKSDLKVATGAIFDMWDNPGVYVNNLTGGGTIDRNQAATGTLTIGVDNGTGASFTGVIKNTSGTTNLTKTGSGTQSLSGANTYSGTTTVNSGTLALDFSVAGAPATNIVNSAANNSALALTGGTFQLKGGTSAANSQRFNGLTLTSGASSVQLAANGKTLLLTLGAITHTTGATTDFTLPAGTVSATNGITTTSGTAGTVLTDAVTGGAYATVGGTDWAAISATGGNIVGLSTITGSNGYTAVPAGGTMTLTGNADLTTTTAGDTYTLAANSTPTTIRNLSTATNISVPTGTTLSTGGILSSQNLTINGAGTLTGGAGSSSSELVIIQTANTNTINAVIADNGTSATAVTKSGAGTLTLTAANTYSGPTTLNAGTLNLANASALGNAGSNNIFTIASGTIDNTSGAPITTLNYAQKWAGSFTFTGTNALDLGTGAVTLTATPTVTVGGSGLTVDGAISGTGFGLTKAGNGTLTLTGANTYSGATTVSAGTLISVNPASAAGNGTGGWRTSAISIASGATLQFALNSGGWEAPNSGLTISGAGTLLITGSNTLRLGGQSTPYATTVSMSQGGLIDVEGGILELDYATSFGAWANNKASMTIASGATFDVWDYINGTLPIDALNGGGTIQRHYAGSGINIGVAGGSGTFSGVIKDGNYTMNVTKSGAGTQTLSGTNTYTGTTTVNGGALVVSGSIAGSTAVVNGGSLQVPSGGTVSSTTVTLNSGSIVASGTITNATTVNGGTLSGTGTVGGLVTVNTGGTLTPGQSGTGFLLLNNGLTLNSGGHLALTLAGTSFGTQYPGVGITGGAITLGGDLQLTLGYTPAVGDIFFLVVNQAGSTINGTFSNAVDQGNGTGLITAGGDQFLVSYSANYASDSFTGGQDIALQVMSVVPEPSTWTALLGGATMLLGLRRRRKVS